MRECDTGRKFQNFHFCRMQRRAPKKWRKVAAGQVTAMDGQRNVPCRPREDHRSRIGRGNSTRSIQAKRPDAPRACLHLPPSRPQCTGPRPKGAADALAGGDRARHEAAWLGPTARQQGIKHEGPLRPRRRRGSGRGRRGFIAKIYVPPLRRLRFA